jgi:hypothetical protein
MDIGKKTELELFCQLTEEERLSRALMLAETVHAIDETEAARTALGKEFREKITGLLEQQRKLSRILHDQAERRLVECRTFFHVPIQGSKRIVRMDTGEMVREEAMTAAELQLNIFAGQREFEEYMRGQDVSEQPPEDKKPGELPKDPG